MSDLNELADRMRYAANPEDLAVAVGEYVAAWEAATSPDSLDAAWAEAEAALPEGWRLCLHGSFGSVAFKAVADSQEWAAVIEAPALTPAAALRALAAKLREAAG